MDSKDYENKYWLFLHNSMLRSLDEMYILCETNENLCHCNEVLTTLDNLKREFDHLSKYLQSRTEENVTRPEHASFVSSRVYQLKSRSGRHNNKSKNDRNKHSRRADRNLPPISEESEPDPLLFQQDTVHLQSMDMNLGGGVPHSGRHMYVPQDYGDSHFLMAPVIQTYEEMADQVETNFGMNYMGNFDPYRGQQMLPHHMQAQPPLHIHEGMFHCPTFMRNTTNYGRSFMPARSPRKTRGQSKPKSNMSLSSRNHRSQNDIPTNFINQIDEAEGIYNTMRYRCSQDHKRKITNEPCIQALQINAKISSDTTKLDKVEEDKPTNPERCLVVSCEIVGASDSNTSHLSGESDRFVCSQVVEQNLAEENNDNCVQVQETSSEVLLVNSEYHGDFGNITSESVYEKVPLKRRIKSSKNEIHWSTFDIVMADERDREKFPVDKTKQSRKHDPIKKPFYIEPDNFVEFPDLVPLGKRDDHKILSQNVMIDSDVNGNKQENTISGPIKNFAAVVIQKNMSKLKETAIKKCEASGVNYPSLKTNKPVMPVKLPLPQRTSNIQNQKTRCSNARNMNLKLSIDHKESHKDEDGWEKVRGKTKREDRTDKLRQDFQDREKVIMNEKIETREINHAEKSKSKTTNFSNMIVLKISEQSQPPKEADADDKTQESAKISSIRFIEKKDNDMDFNNTFKRPHVTGLDTCIEFKMACESVPHHDSCVEDDKIENEADINTRSEMDLEEQRINEEEIRKSHELEEQELILTKKIKDLESTDIEEDIESDDVVTFDPTSMHRDYTEYLKTIPWSDQIDEMEKLARMLSVGSSDVNPYVAATVEQFEELVKRYPGRAQELRMKLSSRSERKDSEEKNLARRQKADEKRQQLLTEKAAKMRELVQKVEEVKAQQFQLAEERKYRLYLKLKKAEENRQLHLSVIRRKAHDEEEKLKEIAFINELEAQNRRHESLALRQEQEERLQTLIEERQRKVGEKAAKEAAVEERRRVLEAERQEKLEKMQEKRRKKEEIIGRKQREKENERLEIAREKAREREERLQARQAAQIATAEELQKKIQQKQESSARRHEESIELKRQKALERGSLRTIISDEESYQSSTKHGIQDDYRSKGDPKIQKQEGEKSEKLKAYRKRAKKIRMRISTKGKEFMERSHQQYIENCTSIAETSKPLEGLSNLVTKDLRLWDNEDMASFDQYSTDLINLMKDKVEQECFQNSGGYLCLSQLYLYFDDILKEKSTHTFNRIFMKVNTMYKRSCFKNTDNVKFLFQSGYIFSLCDSLRYRINGLLERRKGFHCDTVLATLTEMLNEIELMPDNKEQNFRFALNDFMSYVVCSGLIGRLVDFIRFVTESEDTKLDYLIAPTIEFFSALTKLPSRSVEYIDTLESSDLMGVLSLLYCSLQEASPKSILPTFTTHTMKFLLTVARSDIKLFQGILGAEGMYLQLRHIASYLLTFCAQDVERMNLLHLVIEIIGFFSVHNKHNQMLLQSGQMPTVLQQLVCLPFKYFCEKQLSNILFPTLIACCHDNPTNKALLENELNYTLLDKFLNTDEAHSIKLIKTFLDWKE